MTKTFLTIALAAATLPLAFAAPQAKTAPSATNQDTTQQQPKKHVKKSHKTAKKTANNAAPAKPAK